MTFITTEGNKYKKYKIKSKHFSISIKTFFVGEVRKLPEIKTKKKH